ncbi:WYL domain-containing protein [Nocardioides sp. CER19]|uniref:helix-turn-helix transcriptional regulator n=1 Tax=Nocardioides sp. CER19 TaxID=3038538 RepID=UPI00244C5789|nr:WYL domain-containing protein [Nocardioides sp. CER19]MDH2415665.1 WYL domain-containing protein [Nocardioides sp. CER19]
MSVRQPVQGAREQVARLLALVPYLHAHDQVRLDEAAAAFGVTERQLVKDLRVLFMCGLPGGYPDDLIDVDIDALEDPEGDRVIRVTNADYLSRPLRLTPTEATAVIVALRALRSGATSDATREVVDRALAKLEQAAAEGTSTPLVDPGDAPDAALLELRARLQDAVGRQRQVGLVYYVPSRDEESVRVVDPRGLVEEAGSIYLDAWCHLAEAPRWFRLDRIRSAEVLDSMVTTTEGPRELAPGIFTQEEDVALVTLDVAPAAYWITEYYPVEAVRPGKAGHHQVDLLVADARWLTRLLLRLAPYARVIAPSTYAEAFAARARETRALYGSVE